MNNKYTLCKSDEFHELLTDYIHGASVLVRRLLYLAANVSGSGGSVLNDLEQARKLLRRAHPEMVSLSQAITLILKRVEEGTDAGTASRELELSWNANLERVIDMAVGYLAQHQRVLTISYSGLVRDAILKSNARGDTPEVYLGEGRPKYEGLVLARELAEKSVPCTVFADSAFASFMKEVDCVLIGADAVSPTSLLNKIGTTAILRETKARDLPTASIYDFLKMVDDAGFPDKVAEYPAEELLADPVAQQTVSGKAGSIHLPSCMRVVNQYFEVVPRQLVDVELADQQ